jgi:hypothetical protein
MMQVFAYATQARIHAFEILLPVERFARHRRTRARPPGRVGARRLRPAARGRHSIVFLSVRAAGSCNRRVPSVRPSERACSAALVSSTCSLCQPLQQGR